MDKEVEKALKYILSLAEEEAIRVGEYTEYKRAKEILENHIKENNK